MSVDNGLVDRFRRIAESLRRAHCRPEIELTEIRAPVAQDCGSLAFSATVHDAPARRELATGRFLLIHAPARRAEWGDSFRIVTYVKAEVERDLGHDELMASVAWSWLLEALDRSGAVYSREGGTASRLLCEGFGQLAHTEEYIDVELRASWTPQGEDLSAHLAAWADMVCTFGGLPPAAEDVVPLRRRP